MVVLCSSIFIVLIVKSSVVLAAFSENCREYARAAAIMHSKVFGCSEVKSVCMYCCAVNSPVGTYHNFLVPYL